MRAVALFAGLSIPLGGCTSQRQDGRDARTATSDEASTGGDPSGIAPATQDRFVPSIELASSTSPTVEGALDGGSGRLLLLDTGATETIVSREEVGELGLPTHRLPPNVIIGAWSSAPISEAAVLQTVRVGNLTLTEVEAVIADLPEPFSLVLGMPFLIKRPVLFDGMRGVVQVLPTESVDSHVATMYPGRTWTRIPLLWADMTPVVKLPVGTKSVRFLVDTGSNTSFLDPTVAASLGLQSGKSELVLDSDFSSERTEHQDFLLLDALQLGKWRCLVEFAPSPEGRRLDGVLGFDLLAQIPFVFDAQGQMLWVIDPAGEADARLESTQDSRGLQLHADPLPSNRAWFARAVGATRRSRFVSLVADLLNDESDFVRNAAAEALSVFAETPWPAGSQVERARAWWRQHEHDAAFQLPHSPGD
jgi:predicted aspartyl protease